MQNLKQLLVESDSIPCPDTIIETVQRISANTPVLYANFSKLKNTDYEILTIIYKSSTQNENLLRYYVYYGVTNVLYEVHSIRILQEVKQVIKQFNPSFSYRSKPQTWLKIILLGCFLCYVTDKRVHRKVGKLLDEAFLPSACSILYRNIMIPEAVPLPVKNTAHILTTLINTALTGRQAEAYFHTLYNIPLDKFSEQ